MMKAPAPALTDASGSGLAGPRITPAPPRRITPAAVALVAAAFLLSLGWLGETALAQEKVWTLKGRLDELRFGYALTRVDDLNGDGEPEIAIGAPGYSTVEAAEAGRVYIIDSKTQATVRVLTGSEGLDHLGGSLAGGIDFDGDQVLDLIVGSGQSFRDCIGEDCLPPQVDGRVSIYSGADGSELARIRGIDRSNTGAAVALIPDWNDDGQPDIAVGSTGRVFGGHSQAGRFEVLSGADLSPILTVDGNATGLRVGHSIAVLGDSDGDGLADVAFGAPGYVTTPGAVTILSGTGDPLRVLRGSTPDSRFGYCVAAVPDIDGDDQLDLMVGIPQGADGKGEFRLYGSADRYALLLVHSGATVDSRFGCSVASAGDVDGDGTPDFVVGAPGKTADLIDGGAIHVISGQDGSTLFEAFGKATGNAMGASVAAGWNGPSYSDVVGGAPEADPGNREGAGSVVMLRIAPSLACLKGNVNIGAGFIRDVITVNGRIGTPVDRVVSLDRADPIEIFVDTPPSRTTAAFVLYGYAGYPDESTQTVQPFGLGLACFATPYSGDFNLPRAIWNNLGEPLVFGVATRESTAAPSILFGRPGGIGRRARGTIQGFIRDDASAGPDGLSVTNAILLDVR